MSSPKRGVAVVEDQVDFQDYEEGKWLKEIPKSPPVPVFAKKLEPVRMEEKVKLKQPQVKKFFTKSFEERDIAMKESIISKEGMKESLKEEETKFDLPREVQLEPLESGVEERSAAEEEIRMLAAAGEPKVGGVQPTIEPATQDEMINRISLEEKRSAGYTGGFAVTADVRKAIEGKQEVESGTKNQTQKKEEEE